MDSLNIIINNAIKRCNGQAVRDLAYDSGFYKIYPFTTENINGYIDQFDLNNKSLLTVGSSGDQVINSILKGCKDITVIDINPYTKMYYYLKIACILNLDIDEFYKFLRYTDYPHKYIKNYLVFDPKIYNKIRDTLKNIDYDSCLFWDELLCSFNPADIRYNLFNLDEYNNNVLSNCNLYLKNEENYNKTKKEVKNINPKFINNDLFKVDLNRTFDNIWFSNIGTYMQSSELKKLVYKYSFLLNQNGKILISYLYNTSEDTKYKSEFMNIYDLEKTFRVFHKYNPKLISFDGIEGMKHNEDVKDSVLIYEKKLKPHN